MSMTQSKRQLQVERGRVGSHMSQRCLRPAAVLDAHSLSVLTSIVQVQCSDTNRARHAGVMAW